MFRVSGKDKWVAQFLVKKAVERSKAGNVLSLENLLSAADQALYEAKSANRNCVRLYQPPFAA